MSLEQYSLIAEIAAAVAVVATLLFIAIEVRRNTRQTRLANWESVINRFTTLWSRSGNPALADIIVRGREGLANLSGTERLAFGHYHEELVITYESMIVRGDHPSVSSRQVVDLARKHLSFHFSFPGAREWWAEWKRNAGPPASFAELIDSVIRDGP